MVVRRLEKAVPPLTTTALSRMERELPWFRDLSASDRSWIGVVAQSGISAFVDWFRDGGAGPVAEIRSDVFGNAPTALVRVVTLQQTVAMVRMTMDEVERSVEQLLGAEDGATVRAAMLQFSREVAFAAAEVYARAAEMRGAWDARLEALIVDSVLRGEADEAVRSRASALGWESSSHVAVVLGYAPPEVSQSPRGPHNVIDEIRRAARHAGLDSLCAVQGDRLVVVLGGVGDLDKAGAVVADRFGAGPVVLGPLVPDLLSASASARAAVAGLRAAVGWTHAPRPVAADDLLPERSLSGDGHARHRLVTDVYAPLATHDPVLLDTVTAFLEFGGSIEATARALFVHPNTVRYRLRRITDVTGLTLSNPRDAYTVRIALTLGRLLAPDA